MGRIGWAASTFAPWGLALGLLVSLAAHADPDPETGGLSLSARNERLNLHAPATLIEADYVVGDPDELGALPDEIEPRYAPKRLAQAEPIINRAHKGDPFIALRPGFQAKAHADAADLLGDAMRRAAADAATSVAPLAFPAPAPREETPMPVPRPTSSAGKTDLSDRPGYASLIAPRDRVRQLRCLAEAIYFEARSEPEAGQAAVAQVVLNRVRSGIYPTTVCGVVYQDRERPFACQFSFACEGKSLRIEEPACWATATRIAAAVAGSRIYNPKFAAAINYHAAYVRPFWSAELLRLDRVGLHVFYAMRPGLYWAPGALNGRGDLPPLLAQTEAR